MNYLPSDGELELLLVIWELQPVTVRSVYERIILQKPVGYTTVLKQIQRMHEDKGVLQREIREGIHLYSCPLPKSEVKRHLAEKMIQTAFGGSVAELMRYAMGGDAAGEPSEEQQIAEIKKWLEQKTGV